MGDPPDECSEPEASRAAEFEAVAARWPGGAYDMDRYDTAGEALDAYASFHAATRLGGGAYDSVLFVPNQYGLGNRLRAMKAALVVAMLTGRVFHVRWTEPFPLESLVRPERIDWAALNGAEASDEPPDLSAGAASRSAQLQQKDPHRRVICLPFATAPKGVDCATPMNHLKNADLRAAYAEIVAGMVSRRG